MMAGFAVAAALTVLGLKRARIAGWMLVALGGLPVALEFIATHGSDVMSGMLVGAPSIVAGVCYLLSVRAERGGTVTGTASG
jgi:hypothetical protein